MSIDNDLPGSNTLTCVKRLHEKVKQGLFVGPDDLSWLETGCDESSSRPAPLAGLIAYRPPAVIDEGYGESSV